MKDKFLSKWSSWWSLTKDAKDLNKAFEKELNELIEQKIINAYKQGLENGYYFDGSRSDWEAEGLSNQLAAEYLKTINQ